MTYTWLHHTDTDVPHLGSSDFSKLRGAFLSIDRPYGKVIDFLHHKIGSTHAIHHIAPWMPHYHAGEATIALKNAFPKVYLYNQTPILRALWLISTNCIAVTREENGGRYIWKNPWRDDEYRGRSIDWLNIYLVNCLMIIYNQYLYSLH